MALYCLRHKFPTHVRVCLINSRRALTQADGSQVRAPDSYPDKRQFDEAQEGGKVERGGGDRVGGVGDEMQESERVKGLEIRKQHLAMHAAAFAAVARADNAGICPAGSPQVCLGFRV